MTASYPPPPPTPSYAPRKARPSVVTNYGIFTAIVGIIAIVVGALGVVYIYKDVPIIGAIFIVIGVYIVISGLGILAGQKWALIMGGYTLMAWTKNPEVVEYFGLSPSQPVYPQSTPPPTTQLCSVCGRPLTFVQQYQRWYCQNCQRYS